VSGAALRVATLPDEEPGPAARAAPLHPLPPEPPPAPVPGARRRGGSRRVEMVRRVVAEVEALRPAMEEAVQQYELRITAQLAEILRTLRGESAALARLPSVKTSSALLKALRSVEIKPSRGRPRDLVRLHELDAELTELLTPES
jgi:hypothetical protein